MRKYALLLMMVVLLLNSIGCSVHKDYLLDLSGTVCDQNGMELSGVEVIITVNRPVYDAIEPVNRSSTTTDNNGKFEFQFITDQESHDYSLYLSKEGFMAVEINSNKTSNNFLVKMEEIK